MAASRRQKPPEATVREGRTAPVFRRVPLADLHEDERNARRHPQRNADVVRASLAEFGQVEALVVEAGTGRVLGGNLRLRELRQTGVEEVDVVEVDVHGRSADRLALVLNRSAELAEWDNDVLENIFRELADESDLDALGWNNDELAGLLDHQKKAAPRPDDDDGPHALPEILAVLVECRTEPEQRALLVELSDRGFKVRAQML